MNKITVYLDRHFPYEKASFSTSEIQVKETSCDRRQQSPLARLLHMADLYINSFKADVILGNRRTALMLGLLYHIYKPRKVSLLGYEMIFNFKDNLRNKAVRFLWRIAVKKIDRLIVMSESEKKYLSGIFNTGQGLFRTIPFYAENANYLGPNPEGYIFAAGRMERDFVSLLHVLRKNKMKAVIVADQSQESKLEPLKPDNVSIYYNIPRAQYQQLLEKSRLVVVPLYKGAASRGQVVILEAMKYGKPLICSKVAGTVDYIEDGRTGLLVDAENQEALNQLLTRYFPDLEALKKLGKEAFETQRKKFSPEVFTQNYIATIRELYYKKKNIQALQPSSPTETVIEAVKAYKLTSAPSNHQKTAKA